VFACKEIAATPIVVLDEKEEHESFRKGFSHSERKADIMKTKLKQMQRGGNAAQFSHREQAANPRETSALHMPPNAEAVKAAPTKISRKLTIGQTFQEIAMNCVAQIQANLSGMAQRRDPESLHQMRIGLRRLDSALDLFADFFPLPEYLQTELDWLSAHLGAARDWDVLKNATLPELATVIDEEKPGLSEIEAAIAERAEEKYDAAIEAVASVRYQLSMQKLEDWLQTGNEGIFHSAKERKQALARIPGFAHECLSHAQRQLFKRGEKLRDATPKVRHKVRIAAKKVRYAAEFFDALLAKKTARQYVKSLASLQDELGHLNDMSMAGKLLKELADRHPNLEHSIYFVRGYLAAYMEREAGKIQSAWKAFKKSDLPRQ